MADGPRKDRRGLRAVRSPSADDADADAEVVELTVRVTLGLRRQLRVSAAEDDVTMSDFVIQAISDRIAARKRPRGP